MRTTLTIKNNTTGQEFDLTLDSKQKLKTTLQVLKENLPGSMDGLGVNPSIQSERSKRHLSIEETYEEVHIYSGDRLLVSSSESNNQE